jgi:copper transporter 1
MMTSSNTAITFFRDRSSSRSVSWQPPTSGQYAGACISLTVLAIVCRVLAIIGTPVWHRAELRRRGDGGAAAADKLPLVERVAADPHVSQATPKANRIYELAWAVMAPLRGPVLWGLVDLPRLALEMTMSVVMYPLVVAVITTNVGYIMSVLAGVFVGELAVRRYYRLDRYLDEA